MDDITLIQEAIDEWRKKHYEISYNQGFLDGYKMCEKRPPRWIPCSEKLPEKQGLYLVTDSRGVVVRHVFNSSESSREYWMRCARAWMPMPEPYRGGEQDG